MEIMDDRRCYISRARCATGTLVVLLLASVMSLSSGSSIEVELETNSKFIRKSTTFVLTCSVFELAADFFNTQDNAVTFEKVHDSHRIATYTTSATNTSDDRYELKGYAQSNRYVVTLKIPDNIEEDVGSYQCTVVGPDVERGSPAITIEWMRAAPVEFPKCEAYPIGTTGRVRLSCKASGTPAPTLIWYSGESEESTTYDSRHGTSIQENQFTVDTADLKERYECRYSYANPGEADERSCWIGKPVLTVLPGVSFDDTFYSGDTMQVTFIAHAQPQLTKPLHCTWDYEDQSGFSVKYDGNQMATVTVEDVQPEMNGTSIRCRGYNFLGNTTASYTMLVDHPNEENLTASVTSEDIFLTIGETVTLNCEIGFTPPVADVEITWCHDNVDVDTSHPYFRDRFVITEPPRSQLVLLSATSEDDGRELSCKVRFGQRLVSSRMVRLLVRPAPTSQIFACPYSLDNPVVIVPAFFCLMGVVACIYIIYRFLYVICRRKRARTKSFQIEHGGEAELRTSSFGSSIGSEQHFERVTIPDKSGLLERPPSLPSSRCLPSVPHPSSLTPVHEYETTPKNETYSLIKNDIRAARKYPSTENIQQAYMDMGRNEGNKSTGPSTYSDKIPPANDPHSRAEECINGAVGGVPPPLPTEGLPVSDPPDGAWYLEVKKTPDQFNELEDLYRETAQKNVYIPRDK